MRPKVPPASTRDQRAVGGQTDGIMCRYYTVTGRRAHFSSLLRRLSTEKVVLWYESEASGITLARTVFSPVATARSLPHYKAPSPSLPPTPFSLPLRSEIKSVIQQNNLKSFGVGEGEGFLFSLVCATPPPLHASSGQLICFRSRLCVQPTVCSQRGAWRPAFVSAVPF